MITAPRFALLDVNGADAASFLHSQLAADVRELASGHWRFACYCEPDGRVQALMLLARLSDQQFHLLLPLDLAEPVLDRLIRYRLRARCTLNRHALALRSSAADADYSLQGSGFSAHAQIVEADMAHTEPELWNRQMDLGQAWLTQASSGLFLPQMLGYAEIGAFSLRKGCFPGQEIVARTHYLGRSKRRLVFARVEAGATALPPGSEWCMSSAPTALAVLIAARTDGLGCLLVAPETLTLGTALTARDSADSTRIVIDRDDTETKRDASMNGGTFAVVRA